MLSEQQVERYSRQILLPQLGGRGQQRLLSASVAVVGSGSVSTVAAQYLAAAGVGTLTLAKPSPLSELTGMNPDCRVSPLPSSLTHAAAAELARDCNVIVASGAPPEVCDILNTACVASGTTLVWGDAVGALGAVAVFGRDGDEPPCYACVHAQLSHLLAAGDKTAALAETTAAFVGTLQATEAIKDVLGLERPTPTRVMAYDAVAGTMGDVVIARVPHCTACTVVRT